MEVDGVDALRVTESITVLRGVCSKRLKFDIEYSRKRGTTDNTYLVKVSCSWLPPPVASRILESRRELLRRCLTLGLLGTLRGKCRGTIRRLQVASRT